MPSEDSSNRVFVVVASNICEAKGRYVNASPDQAAKKAGRQLLLRANRDSAASATGGKKASPSKRKEHTSVEFTLVEHLGGRNRGTRQFTYKTVRKEKATPTVFKINGQEIVSKYDYVTHAV